MSELERAVSEFDKIIKILNEANISTDNHAVGLEKLVRILSRKNFEDYADVFRICVYAFVQVDHNVKNEYVDRFLLFISLFCEAMQEEHTSIDWETDSQLVESTLLYLTQLTSNRSISIRIRSCQFVGNICYVLRAHNLTLGLRATTQHSLLEALKDSIPKVRAQAVLALVTYQDGEKWRSCQVTSAIGELLQYDSSPPVRRICVDNIILKEDSLNAIVKASNDVHSIVRLALYKKAMKHPLELRVAQKQYIIFNAIYGAGERSLDVLKYVKKDMYPAWLKAYDFNYLRLLRLLRLNSTWEEGSKSMVVQEHVLRTLFKARPLSEILQVITLNASNLFEIDDIDWDRCIYWRILISHLLIEKMPQEYNKVIPTMPDLQRFIEQYCVHMKEKEDYCVTNYYYQFILMQLFLIIETKLEEQKAEHQRSINKLVKYVFSNSYLDFDVIKEIIKILEITISNDGKRTAFVCGQANAVLQQFPKKQLLSDDFSPADLQTIVQWLNVVAALLYNDNINYITPQLHAFKQDFLDTLLLHANIQIRTAALRCFGYYCLLDEDITKETISFFCEILIEHNGILLPQYTELLCVCAGVLGDAIMIHGAKIFFKGASYLSRKSKNSQSHVTTLASVIRTLQKLLNDESILVQQVATRSVCTILLKNRIVSHKLIIPLIEKYFLMDTTPDSHYVMIQQYIEITLGRLTLTPSSAVQFEKAALEFTDTVFKAEQDNRLGKIDIANMIQFLTSLCHTSKLLRRLFYSLGSEIEIALAKKPNPQYKKTFTEMAQVMKDAPITNDALMSLLEQVNEIRHVIDDAILLKYLKIFNACCSHMLQKRIDNITKQEG